MTAKKRVSRRSLKSNLRQVDEHVITPREYDEAPELTDEMLARGVVKKAGPAHDQQSAPAGFSQAAG